MIDALIASLHYCVAEQKQCDRTIRTIISVTIVLPFPQDYYSSFSFVYLSTVSIPDYCHILHSIYCIYKLLSLDLFPIYILEVNRE